MITIEKKRKRSDRGAANKSPGHLFYPLCVQEYPLDLLFFLSLAVRSSDSFVRAVTNTSSTLQRVLFLYLIYVKSLFEMWQDPQARRMHSRDKVYTEDTGQRSRQVS